MKGCLPMASSGAPAFLSGLTESAMKEILSGICAAAMALLPGPTEPGMKAAGSGTINGERAVW